MKKILAFGFTVLLILVMACSKDDTPASQTLSGLKLKAIYTGTKPVAKFWYDSQGRLTSRMLSLWEESKDSTTYTYGNDNTLVINRYEDGILSEIEFGTLVNGLLISSHGARADSSTTWQHVFTYDESGYLTKMENSNGTMTLEFTNSNGNITSVQETHNGGGGMIFHYEYDPNTTNTIEKFETLAFFLEPFLGKSSKNLTTKTVLQVDSNFAPYASYHSYFTDGSVKEYSGVSSNFDTVTFTYW